MGLFNFLKKKNNTKKAPKKYSRWSDPNYMNYYSGPTTFKPSNNTPAAPEYKQPGKWSNAEYLNYASGPTIMKPSNNASSRRRKNRKNRRATRKNRR